ncbi:MAG: hypothetical protein JKY65_23365 [Planctomycetes bacterium]|nr:hypothetical protein [Planctomycetota bacterium]
MRVTLTLFLVLALCAFGLADEVVLKNGRVVRGKIVRQNKRVVVIRSNRGKLSIPRSAIAEVISALTPRQQFSARRAKLAEDDTKGRIELADWAAANGLGRKALELHSEARGMILARRLAKASEKDTARAYVGVFHWARRSGVDRATLVAILGAAGRRDRDNPELLTAALSYARQLAVEEERLRKSAAALRRPRYRDPKSTDGSRGTSKTWSPQSITPPRSADELDRERKKVAAAKAAMKRYARAREARRKR